MSTALRAERIAGNPKFHELVRRRDSLAWTLSILVMVLYYGFILLIAFAPGFLTQPLYADSVIPLGMPLGVGVIVGSILLTGIYVYKANTTFDQLTREIVEESSK